MKIKNFFKKKQNINLSIILNKLGKRELTKILKLTISVIYIVHLQKIYHY